MRGVALAFATLLALPAHAGPPLDITDSDFATRVRDAVAERWSAPVSHRYWATSSDPEVIIAPRFLFVRDRGLTLPAPPWFGEGAYVAAFDLVRRAWYSTQPDRARALLVFSTFPDGGEALFYLALANDITGLGTGQPAAIFDDTPGSVLDGVAWLGDVDTLEAAGDAYFREAFIHEIAHRWSAYSQVAHPALERNALLGRQLMHWSYFVDSGMSPMEGNGWARETNGSFRTTFTTPPTFRFSPLDLYLMGVLPPESVPPFLVLRDFVPLDPPGANITRESAPAHRSGQAVRGVAGSTVEVSIDHIIAGSGPRVPAAEDRPVVWPVGIALLNNGIDRVPLEELARLDQLVGELVRDFERASGGRMTLDISIEGAGTIAFGDPCDALGACDRTKSDRCEPIREGGEPVCTRTCEDAADCGPGFCCGRLAADPPGTAHGSGTRMVCLAGARCPDPDDPGEDPGGPDDPGEDPIPPGGLNADASPLGCGCSASRRSASAATSIVLLAALSVRRRRCSRGA